MQKVLAIVGCALAAQVTHANEVDDYARAYFYGPTFEQKVDRIYEHANRIENERVAEMYARRIEAVVYIWQQMTPAEREQFVRDLKRNRRRH